MRHGLMLWREDELSRDDVLTRQKRLQSRMRADGIDALLIYTNHVRSGAVTYLTGFTPYWSDALLMVPAEGAVMFATALSKRVGNWIKSTNPTAEIAHSPQPGRLVGERLKAQGASVVGALELDNMPGGLVAEIEESGEFEWRDASEIFADARAVPDAAELGLVRRADGIAAGAIDGLPSAPTLVGHVTEAAELSVRRAGAEECYVAFAPDLSEDARLARTKGDVALGDRYALRLSVAYNGAWTRRIETFEKGDGRALAGASQAISDIAAGLEPGDDIGETIGAAPLPAGVTVVSWTIEAPMGTRPLQVIASSETNQPQRAYPYGVLTIVLRDECGPMVFARPFGTASTADRKRSVA